MPNAVPELGPETEHAARVFLSRIKCKYAPVESAGFASRARGTHRPDSDVDMAVVLEGNRADRFATVIDMAGIAADVLLETGVLVQTLPLWEDERQQPELFGNPGLSEAIRREGASL